MKKERGGLSELLLLLKLPYVSLNLVYHIFAIFHTHTLSLSWGTLAWVVSNKTPCSLQRWVISLPLPSNLLLYINYCLLHCDTTAWQDKSLQVLKDWAARLVQESTWERVIFFVVLRFCSNGAFHLCLNFYPPCFFFPLHSQRIADGLKETAWNNNHY